jgi:hypothetical protein
MNPLSILKGAVALFIAAGLLAAAPARSWSQTPTAETPVGGSTSRTIMLTLLDGSNRIVRLEGVGCLASICSRVAIESHQQRGTRAEQTELDAISAIDDIRGGQARFELRDGTTKQLSVVPWNRVLYVEGNAGSERIELAHVERAEFVVHPR